MPLTISPLRVFPSPLRLQLTTQDEAICKRNAFGAKPTRIWLLPVGLLLITDVNDWGFYLSPFLFSHNQICLLLPWVSQLSKLNWTRKWNKFRQLWDITIQSQLLKAKKFYLMLWTICGELVIDKCEGLHHCKVYNYKYPYEQDFCLTNVIKLWNNPLLLCVMSLLTPFINK